MNTREKEGEIQRSWRERDVCLHRQIPFQSWERYSSKMLVPSGTWSILNSSGMHLNSAEWWAFHAQQRKLYNLVLRNLTSTSATLGSQMNQGCKIIDTDAGWLCPQKQMESLRLLVQSYWCMHFPENGCPLLDVLWLWTCSEQMWNS